jgi:CPA2 family monovalent cation:H+ antiporter-2
MEMQAVLHLFYIYGLSVMVVILCHRLRVPTIVGFLVTGVVAGPNGLSLVPTSEQVEILAEWGVVLLLFTVGMEFSPRRMIALRSPMLLGGGIQVMLSVGTWTILGMWAGIPWSGALAMGFMASMSSTAIILKSLQERGTIDTPHGRISLAIIIFQDILVVVMLMLLPWLGGSSAGGGPHPLLLVAKGVVLLMVILVAGRVVVPRLLRMVAATRNRELFLISVVVILLAVASLSLWAGLSLALGAFLAGLILAESPYAHQIVGSFIPMRDLFISLFFVSIGMMLDPAVVWDHPQLILAGLLLVMLSKSLAGAAATMALGYTPGISSAVGLTLSQVGEFSFILARVAMKEGLMDLQVYKLVLVVIVMTMALTPFILPLGERMARTGWKWEKLGWMQPDRAGRYPVPQKMEDHMIIAGFGVIGQMVAQAGDASGIPYMVIEMNPQTVERQRESGVPIIYGDAANQAVLKKAGIEKARVMVVAVADPVATRQIVATAKSISPTGLHVIARTRYVGEMDLLFELGADEVVAEEYETAMEIFARALRRYLVSQEDIQGLLSKIRSGGYEMLRDLSSPWDLPRGDLRRFLPDVQITTVRVKKDAVAEGKTIGELALRSSYGVTVLAVERRRKIISNPDAAMRLEAGDLIVLMAREEEISRAQGLFSEKRPG